MESTFSRQEAEKRALSAQRLSPKPPLTIHSHPLLLAWSVLSAAGFFWFQTGLQWLIYGGDVHWATGAISAVCVGGLSFWLFEVVRRRRLAYKARFEAIAEANHHIRNALEAIQGSFYLLQTDPEHIQELQVSVKRICWVLNEVLPPDRH